MQKILWISLTSVWLVFSQLTYSEENNTSFVDHIIAYNPNFFGIAIPTENDPLEEEEHLEFYLSIQYPIWHGLHFVYNGSFDFYVQNEQYSSSPVLSRIQNPGINYNFPLIQSKHLNHYLEIGWFHESNGQSLELAGADQNQDGVDDGVEIFQIYLNQRNLMYAINQVSRGWDYASFRYRLSDQAPALTKGYWALQADLRFLCDCQMVGAIDKEDEIWWNDDVDAQIQDYDGIRLRYDYVPFNWMSLRAEFKTGINKILKNNGGKLSLNFKVGDSWVSLFAFDGYGKDPATYHLKTSYIGLGLEFD